MWKSWITSMQGQMIVQADIIQTANKTVEWTHSGVQITLYNIQKILRNRRETRIRFSDGMTSVSNSFQTGNQPPKLCLSHTIRKHNHFFRWALASFWERPFVSPFTYWSVPPSDHPKVSRSVTSELKISKLNKRVSSTWNYATRKTIQRQLKTDRLNASEVQTLYRPVSPACSDSYSNHHQETRQYLISDHDESYFF